MPRKCIENESSNQISTHWKRFWPCFFVLDRNRQRWYSWVKIGWFRLGHRLSCQTSLIL